MELLRCSSVDDENEVRRPGMCDDGNAEVEVLERRGADEIVVERVVLAAEGEGVERRGRGEVAERLRLVAEDVVLGVGDERLNAGKRACVRAWGRSSTGQSLKTRRSTSGYGARTYGLVTAVKTSSLTPVLEGLEGQATRWRRRRETHRDGHRGTFAGRSCRGRRGCGGAGRRRRTARGTLGR